MQHLHTSARSRIAQEIVQNAFDYLRLPSFCIVVMSKCREICTPNHVGSIAGNWASHSWIRSNQAKGASTTFLKGMNWQPSHPVARELIKSLRAASTECYLVGGAVRDLLLAAPETRNETRLRDYDFVVAEPALAIARRVADTLGWAYYPLDEAREVARILVTDGNHASYVCDIARMRGASIEEDLSARDFTINALALGWDESGKTRLIDCCDGARDLRAGVVRRVSPVSLAEDAVRILRAARFVAQFDFQVERETEAQIVRLAHTLPLSSAERLRDELWKALATPRPARALRAMERLGLLSHILPEVSALRGVSQSSPHHEDVFEHTLRTLEVAHSLRMWILDTHETHAHKTHAHETFAQPAQRLTEYFRRALHPWRFRLRQLLQEPLTGERTRADWLVWHALFHDVGKPATQEITQHTAPRAQQYTGHHPAQNADVRKIRFLRHAEYGAQLVENRLAHLRFSRSEINVAARTTAGHMRPHDLYAAFPIRSQQDARSRISPRALYRFYRDTTLKPNTQLGAFDILLLALCDHAAIHTGRAEDAAASTQAALTPTLDTYADHIAAILAYGFAQIDAPPAQRAPLVDGRALMQHLQLAPGPRVGELLEEIQEAQAAGEITTRATALALAQKLLARPPHGQSRGRAQNAGMNAQVDPESDAEPEPDAHKPDAHRPDAPNKVSA